MFWEDIPRRRPIRRGEAWERYHQRMRERTEDQRERVVSALLAYKIFITNAFKHLHIESGSISLFTLQPLGVLLLLSCFLEMNMKFRKNINLYGLLT